MLPPCWHRKGGNHDAHRRPNRTFFRELQIQLTTLENGKQEEERREGGNIRHGKGKGRKEEGVAVSDGRERASGASEVSARHTK